jgi:hypothetical protein
MAKVFGIHHLELQSGVNAEDFERFIAEEGYPATAQQDLTLSVLKGERGAGVGTYLLMSEFESVAARDRYFPASGEASEAWQSLAGQWFETFLTFFIPVDFTDYVAVGK